MMSTTRKRLATIAAAAVSAAVLVSTPAHADAAQVRAGTGWVASMMAATPTARPTLVIASPAGARTVIGSYPAGTHVVAMSKDGRRVALLQGTAQRTRLTVLTLATRTGTSFSPGPVSSVTFTRDGNSLILTTDGYKATRRSLTGAVLTRYSDIQTMPFSTYDGRYLISATGKGGLKASDVATGKVVRRYALPAGYDGCWPTHNVAGGRFFAQCVKSGRQFPVINVFRYSVGGGAPVNETGWLKPAGVSTNVWYTPSGTYAHTYEAWDVSLVVKGRLVTVNKPGIFINLVANGAYQTNYDPNATRLPEKITRYDLSTGRATVVVSGTRAQPYLLSSVILDPTR